jgi:protein gp37
MVEANWHTYQVLTKRADRLSEMLSDRLQFAADKLHIWWGVSVEDKKYGLPRIEHLRSAPAAVRFLSIEPLLEDLREFDISGIDWAIVGGESGPGARRMEQAWVERILKLCTKQRVSFFFKQWGGVQKSKHGRILNGRTFDDMPHRFVAPMPPRQNRLALANACKIRVARWTPSLINLGSPQMADACA